MSIFKVCSEWKKILAVRHPDELSQIENIELDKHLLSCSRCRAVLAEYHEMDKLIRASLMPDRPLSNWKELATLRSLSDQSINGRFVEKELGQTASDLRVKDHINGVLIDDSVLARLPFHKRQSYGGPKRAVGMSTRRSYTMLTDQRIIFSNHYSRVKRTLDIIFTLLILPLVVLIATVIAICIKLDSEGPVLLRQKRIGRNGTEFEMFKFRSMYVDIDSTLDHKKILRYMHGEKLNEKGTDTTGYKSRSDPRITRVGYFIRKTRLDELPQFWNVLHGDIALVGPRPPLPYEVELYGEHEWLLLLSKPGLIGVWQTCGRSEWTKQEMLEIDIDYLKSQSLWKDLKLIILAARSMIMEIMRLSYSKEGKDETTSS